MQWYVILTVASVVFCALFASVGWCLYTMEYRKRIHAEHDAGRARVLLSHLAARAARIESDLMALRMATHDVRTDAALASISQLRHRLETEDGRELRQRHVPVGRGWYEHTDPRHRPISGQHGVARLRGDEPDGVERDATDGTGREQPPDRE